MSETPSPQPPVALLSITAPRAISLCRRWLIVSAAFHVLMAFAIVVAIGWSLARELDGWALALVAIGWFAAAIAFVGLGVRARRLAADAIPLIASGAFDVAEDRITRSLASFSVLRSTKLVGLQQLAMLRHAQSRWTDAAGLTRELLARQRGYRERAFEVPTRLVLAESLTELGDLAAAARELDVLGRARLDLRETLLLTLLRLEFEMRRDDPHAILANFPRTLAMLELLPPPLTARAHAILAWAAWRAGDAGRHAFCAARTRLLSTDLDALIAERPTLRAAFA